MRRAILLVALTAALLSVGDGARAQGYPPLSFAQMIQLDEALIRQQRRRRPTAGLRRTLRRRWPGACRLRSN